MHMEMTEYQYDSSASIFSPYQEQVAKSQPSFEHVPPNVVPLDIQCTIPSVLSTAVAKANIQKQGRSTSQSYVCSKDCATQYRYLNSALNDQYSFYSLEQLQGYYEIGKSMGKQVRITLPPQRNQQYAVVWRVYPNAEDVAEQTIYENESRFTLCSLDGILEAVMFKGCNTKNHVMWYSNDGSLSVWRRTGTIDIRRSVTPSSSRQSVKSDILCPSLVSSSLALSELSTDIHTDVRT